MENNNFEKFKNLMSLTDKENVVLSFETGYEVCSVTFLFCKIKYIAIVTYKDNQRLRKVEVELSETIAKYLQHDFIDPSRVEIAYKVNSSDGSVELLFKKDTVLLTLSEIEEQLGVSPGSLKIKYNYGKRT